MKGGGGEGKVTTEPILQKWQDMPITVIAAFNATLLHTAASMLGMKVDREEKKDSVDDEMTTDSRLQDSPPLGNESISSSQETSSPSDTKDMLNAAPIVSDDGSLPSPNVGCSNGNVKASVKSESVASSGQEPFQVVLPKIHVNGQGENSGLGKWKSVLKQIEHM